MSTEETVLEFATASFRSVWALELLLALKRRGGQVCKSSDMIKDLRGSRVVVTEALNDLIAAGLVIGDEIDGYRYQPGSQTIDEMVAELEKLYALRPVSVIGTIVSSPTAKLRILSDAFRIKK